MALPATQGYGDITPADVAAITDTVISTAEVLRPQFTVMERLVTRSPIPRGTNQIDVPYQESIFTPGDLPDGEEISTVQDFKVGTVPLTPTRLHITYRIDERAQRFSLEDIAVMAGRELARSQGQRFETDLLALTDDTGVQDAGGSGGDITIVFLRTAKRMLLINAVEYGGPAPEPIYCVIGPHQEFDLQTDLGAISVVASTTPWIPHGLSEDLIKQYGVSGSALAGVPIFRSGYLNDTNHGTTGGTMFAKVGLILAVSKEWSVRVFEESNWPGPIIRSIGDYGVSLGPFPRWVVDLDCDVE